MSLNDTSMSSLSTYLTCQKKYEYRYIKGLRPFKEATEKMDIGTLYHAGAAAGYNALKAAPDVDVSRTNLWIDAALHGVDDTIRNGYDYHGDRRQLDVAQDDIALVEEMLSYFWKEVGCHDIFEEIIAVEEPFSYEIEGLEIRNTFDLVVREHGRIVIYDHKTVGSVKDSLEFLPLDFQVGAYSAAAWKHFGEPVEFVYQMVRRGVPKELTKTGRKSTASKDVNDYIRRERTWKSETELNQWILAIEDIVGDMNDRRMFGRPFLRSPQKGFMGCSGCAYRSICSAELAGQVIPRDLLAMSYTIEAA